MAARPKLFDSPEVPPVDLVPRDTAEVLKWTPIPYSEVQNPVHDVVAGDRNLRSPDPMRHDDVLGAGVPRKLFWTDLRRVCSRKTF